MKRNKWLRAFGSIDDEFIDEASPAAVSASRKKIPWLRIGALAACLCILIGANLWLFLPFAQTPPSVARYSGSEYFEIIERLNTLAFVKPTYKNNADRLAATIGANAGTGTEDNGIHLEGASPPTSPDFSGGDDRESYVEVTDNQVSGVIEADVFKRSTSHIYHLRGSVLHVYSIAGEDSRELGSVSVTPAEPHQLKGTAEMYLSSDCRTVTVLLEYYTGGATKTDIVSVDVSDPTNITERARLTVHGSYSTSRVVGDTLLALVDYAPNLKALNFSREDTFLPVIERGTERVRIPAESIVYPDELTNGRYTVVLKLSAEELSVLGAGAFLSYASDVYVTNERVYATRTYTDTQINESGTIATQRTMTELCALDYTDGIRATGSISVDGEVLDQYSMDEYERVLRVVTSTHKTRYRLQNDGTLGYTVTTEDSASLYCINAVDMTLINSLENFCPMGEEVTSARFKGEEGYVCTARKITFTDPVYFFDLSNPESITFKDTGIIDGFSSSLVDFGEGYLLGIGVSNSSTVKIEIYTEGAESVESAAKYEATGSISVEYKSYYINREQHLVGLAISSRGQDAVAPWERAYVLLAFDGFDLIPILTEPLPSYTDIALARAFIDDGYFYLLTAGGLSVHSIQVLD